MARNPISGIVGAYKGATRGLQNVGRQIQLNEDAGQRALQTKSMPYYGSINPFKGTVKAFKAGFSKRSPSRKQVQKSVRKTMGY